MYFLRDRKLAEALRTDSVSERDQVIYLILFCLPTMIIFSYTALSYTTGEGLGPNAFDIASDICTIFAFALIVYKCFNIYKLNEKKDFIKDYICLSIAIGIQVLLISIILTIPALSLDLIYFEKNEVVEAITSNDEAKIESLFSEDSQIKTGPFTLALTILLYVYMYWRYTTAFKIASGQKEYNK